MVVAVWGGGGGDDAEILYEVPREYREILDPLLLCS